MKITKSIFPVLYEINKLIIKNKGMSRSDLALRFGVTERSITNYVKTLIEMGAPIKSSKNGYEYEIPFSFEPVNNELMIFYSFIRNLIRSSVYIPEYIANLVSIQLDEFFETEDFLKIADHIVYDFQVFEKIEDEVFSSVVNALIRKVRLEITYTNSSGETYKRVIEPYKLYNYSGLWYIVASSGDSGELRLFAMSRITGVTELKQSYKSKITDSKLNEFIKGSFGIYKIISDENISETVTIRFYDTAKAINNNMIFHKDQRKSYGTDPVKGEFVEFSFLVRNTNELYGKILQFHKNAEIVCPQNIRDGLKSIIADLYKSYFAD